MANTYIRGIDCSHYQQNMNMQKVADAGCVFMIAKAGELYQGKEYRDAMYVQNITNARVAGLITGAYYFFRPSSPLTAQRRMFREMWEAAPADLPPIIDVEAADGQSAAYIKNAFQHFYNDVAETWGRRPIVYSRDGLIKAWGLNDYITDPLYYWKALYSTTFSGYPAKFWQYSETYRIPGIDKNLDGDYFMGDIDELKSLVNDIVIPEPPPVAHSVKIICNFLRLRYKPEFYTGQTLIVENGQVLEMNGMVEFNDGIEWQPVKLPKEYGDGIGYISANPKYIAEVR